MEGLKDGEERVNEACVYDLKQPMTVPLALPRSTCVASSSDSHMVVRDISKIYVPAMELYAFQCLFVSYI